MASNPEFLKILKETKLYEEPSKYFAAAVLFSDMSKKTGISANVGENLVALSDYASMFFKNPKNPEKPTIQTGNRAQRRSMKGSKKKK